MADDRSNALAAQPPASGEAPPHPPSLWRVARGLAARVLGGGRRWRWVQFAAAALLLGGFAALACWLPGLGSAPAVNEPQTLAAAMQKLQAGDYRHARQLAQLVLTSAAPASASASGANFVIGAAAAYEAEGAPRPDDRLKLLRAAVQHLDLARQHGWPAEHADDGRFLLGKSLHETARYQEAVRVLSPLQDASRPWHAEARRLLASACLRGSPSNAAKARQLVDALLADQRLPARQRELAILLRCEIALAQQDARSCAPLLAGISAASPLHREAMLLQGRVLLEQAEGNVEQIRSAGELFRQVQASASDDEQLSQQAAYWIGVGLRREGNLAAARQQLARVRQVAAGSPVCLPAALEEAEVLMQAGQYAEALLAYSEAARLAGAMSQYSHPWLASETLQHRLEQGYAQLLDRRQYDAAVKLAAAISPAATLEKSLALQARAHDRWGEHLEQAAGRAAPAEAARQRAAARRHFRRAALLMTHLANLNYTSRTYPDYLWEAGRRFARGRDYQNAVLLLRKHLETESQQHRPLALLGLGQALLSLGKTDEAIAALEECLRDFPKDPASYRARLLASAAHQEKGDLNRAMQLLEANLHLESLTPRSEAWRDSLFALGKVLYDQARGLAARADAQPPGGALAARESALEQSQLALKAAQRRLHEAILRYPDDPQAIQGRYLLAQTHRHLADLPLKKLQTETIESRRAALNRQAQQELSAALASYTELLARLNALAEERPLTEVEQAVLRNAYFHRPAALYDLGAYEAAIQAYSAASNRYQHDPAAVEAYVQIAACYRRLNKPLEARGTLEQAKVVLARFKPDARFTATTRFARDEWTELLQWLSNAANAGAAAPPG